MTPGISRVIVLGPERYTWQHFRPVFEVHPEWAHEFLDAGDDWFQPEPLPSGCRENPPALVLAWSEYKATYRSWITEFRELGVPCLHVVHGMLDWRPYVVGMEPTSVLRPSPCDVIACAGECQRRILRGWGNTQPVLVVGLPRLDSLARRRSEYRPPRLPRLLITTPNDYQTESQRAATLAGLRDIRRYLHGVEGAPDAVWRITPGWQQELGLAESEISPRERPLADELFDSTAVVSAMSTCLIEALLVGLPTACLEYEAVPQFFRPAWNINRPEHIGPVVAGLLNPPDEQLQYQRILLRDVLGEIGTATDSLARAMERMMAREPVDDGVPSSEGDAQEALRERVELLRRRNEELACAVGSERAAVEELRAIKRSRAYQFMKRIWTRPRGRR